MKILAVEASGSVAGVALTEDNILRAEFTLNYKMTHSQTIMPLINEVKQYLNLDLKSIDYIACSAAAFSSSALGIRFPSASSSSISASACAVLLSVLAVSVPARSSSAVMS